MIIAKRKVTLVASLQFLEDDVAKVTMGTEEAMVTNMVDHDHDTGSGNSGCNSGGNGGGVEAPVIDNVPVVKPIKKIARLLKENPDLVCIITIIILKDD